MKKTCLQCNNVYDISQLKGSPNICPKCRSSMLLNCLDIPIGSVLRWDNISGDIIQFETEVEMVDSELWEFYQKTKDTTLIVVDRDESTMNVKFDGYDDWIDDHLFIFDEDYEGTLMTG